MKTSLWGEDVAGRAARLCLPLAAVAVALAGCGAGAKPPPQQPQPKPALAVSTAPQLVSMRRIDGATYETVVVRTDGTAEVGDFIGELTGVVHQQFHVPSRELDQLRRFVEIATHTHQTPAFGLNPSTEYIIFTSGHVLETAKGHVPRQLAGLTGILSALIDRYL